MTENTPGSLAAYGWDSFFEDNFRELNIKGSIPCRITSEYKSSYRVQTGDAEITAVLAGRMRYDFRKKYLKQNSFGIGAVRKLSPGARVTKRVDVGPENNNRQQRGRTKALCQLSL